MMILYYCTRDIVPQLFAEIFFVKNAHEAPSSLSQPFWGEENFERRSRSDDLMNTIILN